MRCIRFSTEKSGVTPLFNQQDYKQVGCYADLFLFIFGPTCTLFDLSIALRLRHDLSKIAAPTPCSGACETWVPLGPHRPGSRSSLTSRSHLPEDPPTCSGPNRPSWRPIGPLDDLPEDSPDDLIHHDLKTWRTRQDLGGFRPKQIDGIWQDV
jgi:hypothetical protein